MRGFRSFYEADALASIGEREGENGEGDYEPGLYRDCWKMSFPIFSKFYRHKAIWKSCWSCSYSMEKNNALASLFKRVLILKSWFFKKKLKSSRADFFSD
jgi:hypothetical protein